MQMELVGERNVCETIARLAPHGLTPAGPRQHRLNGARSKGRQFPNSERVPSMLSFNEATLHWLWKETMNRLDIYRRRVDEGKDLDAAREFCQYVLWSQLVKLFKEHPAPEPLKVDGALLEWTAQELQRTVQDRWRREDHKPQVHQTKLEAINEKLDLIAGRLAQLDGLDGQSGHNRAACTNRKKC
jgi:hypothetical protein